MILEEATFEAFGYYPKDLKPQSAKKILAVCDECGDVRVISKHNYRALCRSCSQKGKGKMHTEEAKSKISEAKKGKIGEEASRWRGGKKQRWARGNAKRKRQLGFTPVLSQKSGEVWHHFTNDYVIGVPEEVHNRCGGKRQKHRRLVLEWLRMHDRVKYLIIQSFKNTLAGW